MKTKPVWFTDAELKGHIEASYAPGQKHQALIVIPGEALQRSASREGRGPRTRRQPLSFD